MHADFSVELGRDDAALEFPWSSADPAVRYCDLKNHPELLQQIPEVRACPELGAFLSRINAAGFPLATAKCDAWSSREVAPEEEIFGDRKFVSYIDLVFEDESARCSFEKHEAFAKGLCRLLGQAPEIPAAVELVIRRCYYHGEGALREAADQAGAGDEDEVEVEFEAEDGAEGEFEAGNEVEPEGAIVGGDRAEVEDGAETRGDDERQSGAANREGADRVGASERTEQRADIGEGHTDAGERSEAEVGETAAGRLDETAADARAVLSGPGGLVSGFSFTAYVTGFGDSEHEPLLRWQIALALLQNALVQLARDQCAK